MPLPKLRFQPVIEPYVQQPIQEFGSTIGMLREDYEEGLATSDRARQALAAVQAAPIPEDQAILSNLNENLIGTLQQAQEEGDYENQRVLLQRALGNYTSAVTPLVQRNQQINELVNQAKEAGISNPFAIRNYVLQQESLNPSIRQQDGFTFSTFDPTKYQRVLSPDVDITNELASIGRIVQSDLVSGIKSGKISLVGANTPGAIPVLIEGRTEYVKPEQVRPLLESKIQESNIQSYLNREKELTRSNIQASLIQQGYSPEEADQIAMQTANEEVSQRMEDAISSVSDAYAFTKSLSNASQISGLSSGSSDDSATNELFSPTTTGAAIPINEVTPESVKTTSENIKRTVTDYDDLLAQTENSGERGVISFAKGILQEKDRRLSNVMNNATKYAKDKFGISDEKVQQLLDSKPVPAENITNKEIDQIENRIKNLRTVPPGGLSSLLVSAGINKSEALAYATDYFNWNNQLSEQDRNISSGINEYFKNNLRNKAFAPAVTQFNIPQRTGEGVINVGEELTEQYLRNPLDMKVVTQEGEILDFPTLVDKYIEETGERIDINNTEDALAKIMPEIKITGVVKDLPEGSEVPPLTATLKTDTKAGRIFGKQLYLIPSQGTESGYYQRIAEYGIDNNPKNKLLKTRLANLEYLQPIEKQFADLNVQGVQLSEQPISIITPPNLGVNLQTDIKYNPENRSYTATFNGREASFNTVSDIRDTYFNIILDQLSQR